MRRGTGSEARRWAALVVLCAAEFVNVLGVTVLVVALPSIGRSLELSAAGLQWVASAYALFFGGFLIVCGRAADLYGRRRIFIAGLSAFAAASLTSGLAGSGTMLILARGAQGLSAALVVPAALAMVSEIFPEGRARDRAVGVWTAVAAGGGAAGYLSQLDQRRAAAEARAGAAAVAGVLSAPDLRLGSLPAGDGGRLNVAFSPSRDSAVVLLAGVPAPGPGRTYQLWLVRGGTATSAGPLAPGEAVATGLRGRRSLAVTVEPAGGSPEPTTPRIADGDLA